MQKANWYSNLCQRILWLFYLLERASEDFSGYKTIKDLGRAVGRTYSLFSWIFHFYVFKRKGYLATSKSNYEKGWEEAGREQGVKRLNVNPDQISQKLDLSTMCLLSILFSGQEQCFWGKPIALSKEGNIIVSGTLTWGRNLKSSLSW